MIDVDEDRAMLMVMIALCRCVCVYPVCALCVLPDPPPNCLLVELTIFRCEAQNLAKTSYIPCVCVVWCMCMCVPACPIFPETRVPFVGTCRPRPRPRRLGRGDQIHERIVVLAPSPPLLARVVDVVCCALLCAVLLCAKLCCAVLVCAVLP